jgi:hypothetical protein
MECAMFLTKDQLTELDELVHTFPQGSTVQLKDKTMYIMGYFSCDQLILSDLNPEEDYEAALKECWSYEAHIFRVKH